MNGRVNQTSPLTLAERLAERVLLPAASEVDRAGRIPPGHLDLFAAHGLYGVAAPADASATDGGAAVTADGAAPTVPDLATMARLAEALASGCLSTTFVWLQHHGAVRAVAASDTSGLRDRWLPGLRSGRIRAGVSQAALRPGPPSVRARRVGDGYIVNGSAPWVTGWGMVDVLHVAARTEDDEVVWGLLDAREHAGLRVEPLRLSAVQASGTVTMTLSGCRVPADRITATVPFAGWAGRDAGALRLNGSLALGVAGRCARLAGSDELGRAVQAARAALDGADAEAMPAARAAAAELALRAAGLLTVATGAGAVLCGGHPSRLLREAGFLLVFGSRREIRADLLRRLAPSGGRALGG